MTNAEILEAVKARKNITGTYHDSALNGYITDAIELLADAGVPDEVIRHISSLGCITSIVTDIWNNDGGAADLSPYTQKRITQLACKVVAVDE